jgi:tetratricopeptide (TPR) repeat protein
MVTPGGRVMILDFGLASSGGTSKLTRTGAQIGSLAYMSPEQLEGDLERLDARADVWALGVTLYELLALRSPFASESPEQTRRAIQDGDPPSLRTRQRATSWDAETVCRTAMENDPVRRYASAADLARDLENVLERRPIEARRAGAWLRARRWSQRHPARAVALALGSLVVVGGPIAYGLVQSRARGEIQAALDEAQAQRVEAGKSKVRAEENFARALRAVRTMLTRLGQKTLENVPQVQTVRREILEDALGFYREFLAEKGDDPALQEELARVQGTIAGLSELLGRDQDALQAHQVESQTDLALLEAAPLDVHFQHLYANSLVRMAGFVQRQQRFDEARAIFEDALERLELLLDGDPSNALYHRDRAIAFASLGDMLRLQGKIEESEELMQRSLEDFGVVDEAGEAEPDDLLRESWIWNDLAQGHRDQRRYDEAWEEHLRALTIREGLVEDDPDNADFRVALGQSQANMGFLAETIDREEATQLDGRARDLPGARRRLPGRAALPAGRVQRCREPLGCVPCSRADRGVGALQRHRFQCRAEVAREPSGGPPSTRTPSAARSSCGRRTSGRVASGRIRSRGSRKRGRSSIPHWRAARGTATVASSSRARSCNKPRASSPWGARTRRSSSSRPFPPVRSRTRSRCFAS